MKNIYDLTLGDLKKYFISIGLKPFRAIQVYEWLYRFHVRSFDLMTNIKKEVIEHLKQDFEIKLYEVVDHQKSADGTEKFLFRLQDGNLIESVLMRHNYGTSICVTSEVGCNMGCAFCASGMKKKLRNLSAGEMVLQLESVYEVIKEK